MDILGIGLPEFLFILVLMLVVLGPKDMVKTGRQIGLVIRSIIRSPIWSQVVNASQEIRDLPTRLVRESGFDEEAEALRRATDIRIDPPFTRPPHSPSPAVPARTQPNWQAAVLPEADPPPDDPGPQI